MPSAQLTSVSCPPPPPPSSLLSRRHFLLVYLLCRWSRVSNWLVGLIWQHPSPSPSFLSSLLLSPPSVAPPPPPPPLGRLLINLAATLRSAGEEKEVKRKDRGRDEENGRTKGGWHHASVIQAQSYVIYMISKALFWLRSRMQSKLLLWRGNTKRYMHTGKKERNTKG